MPHEGETQRVMTGGDIGKIEKSEHRRERDAERSTYALNTVHVMNLLQPCAVAVLSGIY